MHGTSSQHATRNLNTRQETLFLKDSEAYYEYARQWCAYDHWTLEEAANLLTGCVPHRPMFLRGEDHRLLDNQVLDNENRLRGALRTHLEVVKSRKYFGKTYLLSAQVMAWADETGLHLPADLRQAQQEADPRAPSDHYSTPRLQAVQWVVENFWEQANLREPPTAGAIIQALLQAFPELSGEECDLVERVARHPLAR